MNNKVEFVDEIKQLIEEHHKTWIALKKLEEEGYIEYKDHKWYLRGEKNEGKI